MIEDFEAFRVLARACLLADIPPHLAGFESQTNRQQPSLFAPPAPSKQGDKRAVPRIPRSFLRTAQNAACNSREDRFACMYRLLWRLTHAEPHVLQDRSDADVILFERMQAEVLRDVHKCHAFVRFKQVTLPEGGVRYIAWYQPDHNIVRLCAPFFMERFNSMDWTLTTPQLTVRWDTHALHFSPGCKVPPPTQADASEALWRTYYGAIFNPARVSVKLMEQQMPRRFWRALPEAQDIDRLLAEAPARVQAFNATHDAASADAFLPQQPAASLTELADAARGCAACPWAARATQTVFGTGPSSAPIMLVGEQPGDQEDLQGQPFVGPAGQLLADALQAAQVDPGRIYMTNAVKHFKWEPRGKRRIHQRPAARDVAACRPWLLAEVAQVRPQVLIALGATAAQSIFGRALRLQDVRSKALKTALCENTWVTTHPSAILRTPDAQAKQEAFAHFVRDLQAAFATVPTP